MTSSSRGTSTSRRRDVQSSNRVPEMHRHLYVRHAPGRVPGRRASITGCRRTAEPCSASSPQNDHVRGRARGLGLVPADLALGATDARHGGRGPARRCRGAIGFDVHQRCGSRTTLHRLDQRLHRSSLASRRGCRRGPRTGSGASDRGSICRRATCRGRGPRAQAVAGRLVTASAAVWRTAWRARPTGEARPRGVAGLPVELERDRRPCSSR